MARKLLILASREPIPDRLLELRKYIMVFLKERTELEEAERPRINMVLNWFEDLKERVPVPG